MSCVLPHISAVEIWIRQNGDIDLDSFCAKYGCETLLGAVLEYYVKAWPFLWIEWLLDAWMLGLFCPKLDFHFSVSQIKIANAFTTIFRTLSSI